MDPVIGMTLKLETDDQIAFIETGTKGEISPFLNKLSTFSRKF